MTTIEPSIIGYRLKEFNELTEEAKQYYLNMKNALKIKYRDPNFPTLQCNDNGDWIDLRCTEDYTLKAGESVLIDLGVAMKLPDDYEAWLVPRSGTFKKYGLIQTNSIGIIDNSYSGDNDIWRMPVYATRDTEVKRGDRLCQFRLVKRMRKMFIDDGDISDLNRNYNDNLLHIVEVDHLDSIDRGGFGSTGR